MNYLTGTCCGKIYEIVWVDKFGRETPRKYILAELEKMGNRNKQTNEQTNKHTFTNTQTHTHTQSNVFPWKLFVELIDKAL